MTYEDLLEAVETSDSLTSDAREAATEAMAFVLSLHNTFRDNGVDLPVEPDCSSLDRIIDGLSGEVAAAVLFLSEKSFAYAPKSLRKIAESFEELDKPFTDPQGYSGRSVPFVVVNGFKQLANRIEAAKTQRTQLLAATKKE